MDSTSQLKKIERKLRKLHHVVFKETGVTCVTTPTKVNAGTQSYFNNNKLDFSNMQCGLGERIGGGNGG